MCIHTDTESSEATRLRRTAGVLASSTGALAAGPALSLTHGHPVFGWTLIGIQAALLSVSIGMLARSKRLGQPSWPFLTAATVAVRRIRCASSWHLLKRSFQ